MIHVIIPVYNRLELTIRCIKSLEKQNTGEKINIIVVNDCSTDNTEHYLSKNFPKVKILKGTGSLFWGGAISYGIDYALNISKPDDWVLLVNNDVELSINTISELLKILKLKNRRAIAGTLTIDSKDKRTVIKSGTVVKSWFFNLTSHVYNGLNINDLNLKNYEKVNFLTGRCILHPIEIFKEVGNYNSKKFIHYGCDDEFSMRIQKFKYETLLCTSTAVFLKSDKKPKKNFYEMFFDIRSSSNIKNKYNLSVEVVPGYAKVSFFLIGIVKSFYVYLKQFRV